MRFSTPEKFQTSVKGYYRLIYGVDVVLGRIREALIEKNLGLIELHSDKFTLEDIFLELTTMEEEVA